ncbi:Uncharacterised protein [Vibrio cholerae]|nr:Uncharacterised protein [Vibrio cholerae]
MAHLCRLNEDFHLITNMILTLVIGKLFGTNRSINHFLIFEVVADWSN